MKRNKTVCAALLLFAVGLGVFLYPMIQGRHAEAQLQSAVSSFVEKQTVHKIPSKQPGPGIPSEPTEPTAPREHAELYAAMQQYNSRIFDEHQKGLSDAWAYEEPSFYLEDYGLEEAVFGVITIDKLELEMPIFLGATYNHMAQGVAHLSQTSIPIGGKNTNSVLAGHRGWGGAKYFRYITDLVPGDEVRITNLWETMTYRVCQTQIIEPNDVEAIHIKPGRELITLLTCHPYASGGRQRYLVICERIYDECNTKSPSPEKTAEK